MRPTAWLSLLSLALLAGCPFQQNNGSGSAVNAVITISAQHGSAPLTVVVAGGGSSSRNGGTLTYHWDFAGQAQADGESATHTFTSPGLYTVTLRVTDEKGEVGLASVDVRIQGSAPTAVIQADQNSGPAPLVVRLDGTASSAPDDTIRDYLWDFGDGQTSPQATVTHIFQGVGNFTVKLTVTTGGGASAWTTTTISTAAHSGSLQFDGSQFATLPLSGGSALANFTVEAWFKAGASGGSLFSLGNGAVLLEIRAQDSVIRYQLGGQQTEASATTLAGLWRHVALSFAADGDATLYLDGVALTHGPAGAAVSAAQLTVGMGFVGKVAEVRFWTETRTATQISANYNHRLSAGPGTLAGYWRLDEGAGQNLTNRGAGGTPGMRGATTADEATDPAWSTDGPPLQ